MADFLDNETGGGKLAISTVQAQSSDVLFGNSLSSPTPGFFVSHLGHLFLGTRVHDAKNSSPR